MNSRRWFQLHLSTLLVLSFTAAGLLWLNARCSPGMPHIADYEISGEIYKPILRSAPSVGWPRAFVVPDHQIVFIEHPPTGVSLPIFIMPSGPPSNRINIRYKPLLIDVAAALLILLSVMVLSESMVRRQALSPASKVHGRDAYATIT